MLNRSIVPTIPEDLLDAPDVVRLGSREIAGVAADCFGTEADFGSGELCFATESGLMLFAQAQTRDPDLGMTFEATSVDMDVGLDDVMPPG